MRNGSTLKSRIKAEGNSTKTDLVFGVTGEKASRSLLAQLLPDFACLRAVAQAGPKTIMR